MKPQSQEIKIIRSISFINVLVHKLHFKKEPFEVFFKVLLKGKVLTYYFLLTIYYIDRRKICSKFPYYQQRFTEKFREVC